MAHRGEIRYSPNNAQLIHHDSFTALSSHSSSDISSNILDIQLDLDLETYNFPDDAELSLMVKCGAEDMVHIDLGTVINWTQPQDSFDFSGISSAIKVRLSVTPKGGTYYIGYSEWRTCFPGRLESLIRPAFEDLGQIIWLFRIHESDWPTLVLNIKADKDLAIQASRDEIFIGQIFPQCIYSGFMHIAENEFRNTNEGNEGLWEFAWWNAAMELLPAKTELIKNEDKKNEKDIWAKELSMEFAKPRKYFDKFMKLLKKGDE